MRLFILSLLLFNVATDVIVADIYSSTQSPVRDYTSAVKSQICPEESSKIECWRQTLTTVEQYLTEFGYFDAERFNNGDKKYELRRALQQFQRENNLIPVTGRITIKTIQFINREKETQMVIDYLKRYNYLQAGTQSPDGRLVPSDLRSDGTNPAQRSGMLRSDGSGEWLSNAVKRLQRNSGVLNVTGTIDSPTIKFVKTHPYAFVVPIVSD